MSPGGVTPCHPKESSSKETPNESSTGKEATDVAPTTGESGVFQSSISEEKTQGQGLPTLKEVTAWKAKHYVKDDLDFKEWALRYYWQLWGEDYVTGGWQKEPNDAAEYYQDLLTEDKFEEDLTAKMLKLLLPDGLVERTSMRCTKCEATTKQPNSTMIVKGVVVTEGCGDCPST